MDNERHVNYYKKKFFFPPFLENRNWEKCNQRKLCHGNKRESKRQKRPQSWTVNTININVSFSHASIGILAHLTTAEKRNTNTGVTSLSLDMGKVETKWEVQMRSKKRRENILMLFSYECLPLNRKDKLLLRKMATRDTEWALAPSSRYLRTKLDVCIFAGVNTLQGCSAFIKPKLGQIVPGASAVCVGVFAHPTDSAALVI